MSTPRNQLVNLDQVANLLGKPPGWMLYWGNSFIALLVILILGLAALIQYPDEVQATIELTTQPAPVRQVLPKDAVVDEVLPPLHNDHVKKGTPLLLLESTANWQDIQVLATLLGTLGSLSSPVDALGVHWEEGLEIGELGPAYARLLNHLSELQYWLQRTNNGSRVANLQRQLQQNEATALQLVQQTYTAQAAYELAQANYMRFDSLLQGEFASQLEVDQARAQALQARLRLEQQQERQLANQISQERLVQEKLRLSEQLSDEVITQWLGYKRELRNLQYEYYAWREVHVLEAKISGQLSVLAELRNGQQLKAGTPLWGIVPTEHNAEWIAIGKLSDYAIGKITVGNEALIRLPAFPYREYGQLAAKVSQISILSATSEEQPEYHLELELPNGLLTTYQKELSVRQSLSGQARIISEKRSLLARIFDQFWRFKEEF